MGGKLAAESQEEQRVTISQPIDPRILLGNNLSHSQLEQIQPPRDLWLLKPSDGRPGPASRAALIKSVTLSKLTK